MEKRRPPDFGAATTKITEEWERSFSQREDIRRKIAQHASKPHPTVREALVLAWFRKLLDMLEPVLPVETSMSATNVWQYWIDHPKEFGNIATVHDEITTYLGTAEQIDRMDEQAKARKLEMIKGDQVTFMALYPVVDLLYAKKRGRPPTRRLAAVRGLQMQNDNKLTLKEVMPKVCDCGKAAHDEYCEEKLRQSIRALRKLLGECGIELPKP
jgi:hypothetical protein